MSDRTQLEDRLRRALHASADALVVEDRAFEPELEPVGEVHEVPAERRSGRTKWTALVAAAVIVVVAGAAVVVRSTGDTKDVHVGGSPTTTAPASTTAPSSGSSPDALLAQVAAVPVDVLRSVGAGTSTSAVPLSRIDAPLLTRDGKPRIIWIGAEYCPYCAAERWSIVLALTRFGTFSNLGVTTSAPAPEVYPDTQSFSFHGSTYSSPYLTFESVEQEDNAYKPLDTLTAEQAALAAKYDSAPYVSNPGGAIPFVDIANRYLVSGATYDPGVLQGKTAGEIATAMSDPTSDIAKGADGSANVITAAICSLTASLPANVCTDPAITALGPTGPQ